MDQYWQSEKFSKHCISNIATTLPSQLVRGKLNNLNFNSQKNIFFLFVIKGQEAVERIKKMVRTIRVRGQFKGLGGELMKQACATLIKKCALIHFPVHSTEVVGKKFFFFLFITMKNISISNYNFCFLNIMQCFLF